MKFLAGHLLVTFFTLAVLTLTASPAHSQVAISVGIAPPPLQDYDQPVCPDDGYIWTPGYWAYGDSGYYWVPGSWVQPPEIGQLWTPPYWGWDGGAFVFSQGYWGPTVGFYGGVDYGYGYGGHGYGGGRWQGGHFFYNTAVNHVNSTTIHNTYVDRSVVRNSTTRVSYNGGKGGVQARPTAREREVSKGHIVTASSHHTDAAVHSPAATQEKPESHKAMESHHTETEKATETHSAPVHTQHKEHAQHAEHTQHSAPKAAPHNEAKPKQEAHADKKQ